MRNLPIELAGRPYVPVRLNETGPYSFLLDTGALGLSLSTSVALAASAPEPEVREGWVTLGSLAAGSCRWTDVGAGVGDNSALSRMVGRRVDGILGSRWLASFRLSVTLDYLRQTLDLVEVEEDDGPPAAGVPLHLANQYPLVPVHLNGRGPYLFLVDTSASGCVVSPQAAETLQLARGTEVTARGISDDIASYRSVLPLLSVGGKQVEDLPVTVMECAAITANAGTRVDGYLGNDFLSRFVVTLDYAGQRLRLR